MATKKKRLCVDCREIRDNPNFTHPAHLVHPMTHKLGLFDINGVAVCPKCGTKWRRDMNRVELVE